MNVMKRLLEAVQDIWEQYYEHPFVLGIQNGTLEKKKFRYYMIQDYLYLIDYTKVFGIGLAKATSQKSRNIFTKYIQSLNKELDIHHGYMKSLQITQEEIAYTRSSLDNLSYTSYMLRVAYEGSEAETLAAVLSCAVSYEYIANHMKKMNPYCEKDDFYGDWISGYGSKSYHLENEELINMLEEMTEEYSQKQIQNLIEIFVNCSRYELEFWNMAWQLKK